MKKGTVFSGAMMVSMILTGRFLYLFNRVCRRPITRLSGLSA